VSNAAYNNLTEAEIEARQALLRSLGLRPPMRSAQVLDHPARRKPLGLAIIDGPDGGDDRTPERDTPGYLEAKRRVAAAVAGMPEAARNQPATIQDVFEGLELPLAISFDDADVSSKSFKELRSEIATLKAELVEARHQTHELLLVQESMRVAGRGERGVDGARGVPGRDGQQGPAGPRGEQGGRGPPAVAIAAWEPNAERYMLTPVHSDGSRGVPLALRSFFDQYDESTRADED
jgi:hypothetical protein